MTLLGDAAHAQLPALGLGVSTALGDIEELIAQVQTSRVVVSMCSKRKHTTSVSTFIPTSSTTNLLTTCQVQKHGLSRRALRRYERSRMPTCAALQLMSRAMLRLISLASNK